MMASRRLFPCKLRRRGVVTVLVAALLTVILGFMAIALEGGQMRDSRRRLQAAADAAALAAATQIFVHYPAIESSNFVNFDPGGAGAAAALAAAAANGFPNSSASAVVVNLPPASGPFKEKAGYAEVTITFNQPRYLSRIWGGASTAVTARAVARGRWEGTNIGIMVLDPSTKNSLNASGTGSVTVTGGSPGTPGAAVIVNSNNLTAASATGGGGITAPVFEITGGYTGALNGVVETGVPPSPDPLRNLPPPTVSGPGKITTRSLGQGNKEYRLTPGSYSKLPNFVTGDVVIFQQGGIYVINGGGFKSTGASILMDPNTSGGVMIYNNPSGSSLADQIQISGNSAGTVNLSALTDGPYAGILLWQNRTATQSIGISGGGSFRMIGTFYAANALLSVTGNGDAVIGSQYISRLLSLGGGGTTRIIYSDDGTARLREVTLVE